MSLAAEVPKVIKRGDVARFRVMLDDAKAQGVDFGEVRDSGGFFVVHLAAKHNQIEMIRILLQGVVEEHRQAMLFKQMAGFHGHIAFQTALESGNLDAAKLLVEEGCLNDEEREKMVNFVANEGQTALHITVWSQQPVARKVEMISWLFSLTTSDGKRLFTSLFAKNQSKANALHLCALKGEVEVFEAILNSGCVDVEEKKTLVNSTEHNNRTVLHRAGENNHVELVRYIAQLAREGIFTQIFTRTEIGKISAFDDAANSGHLEVCKVYVEEMGLSDEDKQKLLTTRTETQGYTCLHTAINNDSWKVVEWLLSDDLIQWTKPLLSVEESYDGATPLQKAVTLGHFRSFRTILKHISSEEEKRALLLHISSRGGTILHISAARNQSAVIHFLFTGREDTSFDSRKKKQSNKKAKKSDETAAAAAAPTPTPVLTPLLPDNFLFALDFSNFTAVHVAAEKNDLECLRAIIDNCTQEQQQKLLFEIKTYLGLSALDLAAENSDSEEMVAYIKSFSPN